MSPEEVAKKVAQRVYIQFKEDKRREDYERSLFEENQRLDTFQQKKSTSDVRELRSVVPSTNLSIPSLQMSKKSSILGLGQKGFTPKGQLAFKASPRLLNNTSSLNIQETPSSYLLQKNPFLYQEVYQGVITTSE